MKNEFEGYLKALGMTDALRDRVEEILKFYVTACPEEIEDIFVSEYIQEDGTRVYENFWCFSKQYGMEAKDFAHRDNFDSAPVGENVAHWEIAKQDYDFKEAKEKSRMTLEVQFAGNMIKGLLKASKENCDQLRKVFLKYLR